MSSALPALSYELASGLAADAEPINIILHRQLLPRLYISHTLSTWNSRMFEFGAVIFLVSIFPGTLFYTSCYALIRCAAGATFSSRIGHVVDHMERLGFIRLSIGKLNHI
jgi:solute carrier family 40 (iron-regulated transporter), member 1